MYLDEALAGVLDRISHADDIEINEIIQAVIRRYQRVYPGWEVVFLALPKNDPEERKRLLESILAFEKQ